MNIDKGEIVYCNLEVQYEKNKKTYIKLLKQFVFARQYDDNIYPNIDVIKYSMFINKIDKKNAYYISNVKIVNLDILARTGYIAKFD
jgi:hypothetical protein|tara:strand:+ start:269 stop:529 length:261 start_codon:yes stop_codon:yes gene_type:complete